MDWHSWLSKSGLEPSLIYEYGLAFTHRLEILKLAWKEVGRSPNSFSRLILAIKKTKSLFTKKIGKCGVDKDSAHMDSAHMAMSEAGPYRSQWTGAPTKQNSSQAHEQEKIVVTNRRVMRSGPLDRRGQEWLMVTSRSPRISGRLDEKGHERLMFRNLSLAVPRPLVGRVKERLAFPNSSPCVNGPVDGRGLSPKMGGEDRVPSLWSLLFQDMKPN